MAGLYSQAEGQGVLALLALVSPCYVVCVVNLAFGSTRDGFRRHSVDTAMIMTAMLLVIVCAIAAAVPLLAMLRYDIATEPEARELIGKVPSTPRAAGYDEVKEVTLRAEAQKHLIEEQLANLQLLEKELLDLQEGSADSKAALKKLHERVGKDRARLDEELKSVTLHSARNVIRRST
jgi:hypothetical protein